jgi:hypothetical protein
MRESGRRRRRRKGKWCLLFSRVSTLCLLKYSQRMKEKSGMFYLMLYRREK